MKLAIIILCIFFGGCLGLQNDSQNKSLNSNKIKAKSLNVKYDSIYNRDCLYNDLSYNFDYEIKIEKFINKEKYNDSCIVNVIISDKKFHKKIDFLKLNLLFYYDNIFQNCDNVRSYFTGKNENQEVNDNNYGDFIVADFNFDTKEDIAIINECTNSGNLYSFYIQDKDCKYKLDKFLTDSMSYFPSEINKKSKTLVTYIVGGVCWIGEHKYKFDNKINKWKQISHKKINICEEKISSQNSK